MAIRVAEKARDDETRQLMGLLLLHEVAHNCGLGHAETAKDDEEREDRIDAEIARRKIEKIERDPDSLVSGDELRTRLDRIQEGDP